MGRLPVSKTYKMYIGGKFPRTESGRYRQISNAKGEFLANVCRGSRKDVRMAVRAARKAQGPWAGRSAFNRGQILYRMAEMIESRGAAFVAHLMASGHTRKSAEAEVEVAVDRLVWYAGWSDKVVQLFGSTNDVASSHFNFTLPEAMGLVAVFAPVSAPLLGLVSAMAPVIVMGNAVILIVEGDAPHLGIELAEVLATSDLPDGVVNIITGEREELASHVVGHMDVDGVAAYGSDEAGQRQMSLEGAESVKRVRFYDDPTAAKWRSDDQQSPYRILDFLEFKTAWHPVGV